MVSRNIDADICLKPNQPMPSLRVFKNFIRFHTSKSQGRLSERSTVRSMKKSWTHFRSAYKHDTKTVIPKEINDSVVKVSNHKVMHTK